MEQLFTIVATTVRGVIHASWIAALAIGVFGAMCALGYVVVQMGTEIHDSFSPAVGQKIFAALVALLVGSFFYYVGCMAVTTP